MGAKLRIRAKCQQAFTMIELLVVLVIVSILGAVAVGAFSSGIDRANDTRALANVHLAYKTLRSAAVMNGHRYLEAEIEHEADLAQRLAEIEPTLNYGGYGAGAQPSSADDRISVSVEDEWMASVCARSETGKVFCARADELAMLEVPDSPWVMRGLSGSMRSFCAAPSEEQARECLAERDLPGQDDPGPGDEEDGNDDQPGEDDGGDNSEPPPPESFTLTVSVLGDGEGQVSGPGISCPGDCSESYDVGEEVELRAEVFGNSDFLGWSEDCSGRKQTCTVVMNGDRYVGVGFLAPGIYEDAFAAGDVLSLGAIDMSSNASIEGSVHAGASISMNANSEICGDVRYGTTLSAKNNSKITCGGSTAQAALSLPFVDQGNVALQNDNAKLPTDDGKWNPQTRTLQMSSNNTYVIPSGVYSFCRITLNSNTRILIPEGGSVTIYFDSPEACGLASGTAQLQFNSNSEVNADAAMTAPEYNSSTKLKLLFVGSPLRSTKAVLNSNSSLPEQCRVNLILYAPRTDIQMNSNATFCGRVAGKSIALNSNARVKAP